VNGLQDRCSGAFANEVGFRAGLASAEELVQEPARAQERMKKDQEEDREEAEAVDRM